MRWAGGAAAGTPAKIYVGLAREAGFTVALAEPATLRVEAGVPVAGAALVLRHPA